MKINVHAGHNPDGKVACGAVGHIKESTEARTLKDKVINYLRKEKHTVYDCTCNTGTSKNDVLAKIIDKCNDNDVDLDVSIHFNAGSSDPNKKTTGSEVYIYKKTSKAADEAARVCAKLEKIGFKNRGVKTSTGLKFLNSTKAPAMLIEVCFVDDKDDAELYKKNIDNIAKGIAEAIINKTIASNYIVRILKNMYVYASPGGAKTNTVLHTNEAYTITEDKKVGSETWGKLKSGAGWINLKNTKKI